MKFLLISDYDAPLGGIEQYIRDAGALLESDGHQSLIIGLQGSQSQLNRRRGLLLSLTACNIFAAIQLIYHIIRYKPDIIWRHSVSRYIGRFPMWVAGLRNTRQRIMYHDLGYVHPYPSALTQVDQIPHSWTLSDRLEAGYHCGKSSLVHRILMTLKFLSNSMIRWIVLRRIDKHLVPSEFMLPIMVQRGVDITKIEVLGHFGRVE